MLISIVIPAYNASRSISSTLDSIYSSELPKDWSTEVIVVDDGSSDKDQLVECVNKYPGTKLISHEKNQGMCAGRNSGINHSNGEIVTILDADDEFVQKWPTVLKEILLEWPVAINVCYAKCENLKGKITSQTPDYFGELSLKDILNERYSGEYLPIFRGHYIRNKNYINLNMKKSCGVVSYINFGKDGPFWISSKTLRIYNDESVGSISAGWLTPKKANETLKCYTELFRRHSDLYKIHAPKIYSTKRLRQAIYMRFSGTPGSLNVWFSAISFRCLGESIAAGIVLLIGPKIGASILLLSKKIGLLRRYG